MTDDVQFMQQSRSCSCLSVLSDQWVWPAVGAAPSKGAIAHHTCRQAVHVGHLPQNPTWSCSEGSRASEGVAGTFRCACGSALADGTARAVVLSLSAGHCTEAGQYSFLV